MSSCFVISYFLGVLSRKFDVICSNEQHMVSNFYKFDLISHAFEDGS